MIIKDINIEKPCEVKRKEDGISIECNSTTIDHLVDKLQKDKDANILFICSNDHPYNTFHQGYNLKETIQIRNYLNKLIAIGKSVVSNVELRH